jgi:hypothetical protein
MGRITHFAREPLFRTAAMRSCRLERAIGLLRQLRALDKFQ